MISFLDKKTKLTERKIQRTFAGTVVSHEDPEQLGRLKVRVPELYGNIPLGHLPWAHPAEPFGGSADYGFFFIPVPGSKVKIRLWRNHPWFPEWYGVHWFRGETPLESQVTPPHNYVIKTPRGHLIDLHDDNEYIRIKDLHGNYIIIDTSVDDVKIYIQKDHLEQVDGNSDETIGRSKRITTGTKFDLRSNGDIHIRSDTAVAIDAPVIYLNSDVAQPQAPKPPTDVTHETTQDI